MDKRRDVELPIIEVCPKCGRASTVPSALRPAGLPYWLCEGCRFVMAEPPGGVKRRREFYWGRYFWTREQCEKDLREREDKRRLAMLVKRLASEDAATSEGEGRVLETSESELASWLVGLLSAKDKPTTGAALTSLARIDPQLVADGLIAGARPAMVAIRVRTRMRWFFAAFCVLMVWLGAETGGYHGLSWLSATYAILAVTMLVTGRYVLGGNRTKAAAGLRVPRVSGLLAIAHQTKSAHDVTAPTRRELLPKLTTTDLAEFSAAEYLAIARLLDEGDPEILCGALHAVGLFGGGDELRKVSRLLDSPIPGVAEAAAAAAESIKRVIALRKDHATLLRATPSPDEWPDTLLRAAGGQQDPDHQQLLRHPDGDQ